MAAQIDEWIAAYGRAWEERDAEAAAALFSDDSIYRDHPLGPPHLGADGVRKYWSDVTATQAGVTVRFGTPVVSPGERRAAVEFWVNMENAGSEVTLTGILMLRFEPGGRCEELREAWHFEVGRHDPPAGWGL
jgi:SnoaL-like domain